MEVLIFIGLFWVLPIWVGHQIGKNKNRAGWLWGLLLSWVGVLIVALLPRSDPPSGVTKHGDFVTFRPKVVSGSIEAGYTYGFRLSDKNEMLLRQATGSDQWVEVKNPHEKADVLGLMAEVLA